MVLVVSLIPTISISSLTLTSPLSILPVTTVPLPWIVKISSMGIKKGLSSSLTGSGMKESKEFTSSLIFSTLSASPSRAFRAEPVIIGVSSPGKSYSVRRSLTSISTSSISSASSTWSALFKNTTMCCTPTCLARRICSLV